MADGPGPLLRTGRLELRPCRPVDAAELLALFRDPVVRRWLLDDELVSAGWVEEEVRASTDRFARAATESTGPPSTRCPGTSG